MGVGQVRSVLILGRTDLVLAAPTSAGAGWWWTTSRSCARRWRLARDRPFDLVVLDVMLPDGDGFEVVRRLRRDGFGVPVIFLTARDTEADKVAGLSLGGDDYMTKPFGLEELAARVRTVLRRTRPRARRERALRPGRYSGSSTWS
jgi:two-component system OmpR family response regulator